MVAGLPKGATPLPKQAAYGIWVVPAGTYGHGSCGAGKGGGVEHPASSGSLPIPGMSSSCRDNHGQPQPTGMCCPHPVLSLILAWLLFPAIFCWCWGRQFLPGHRETGWPWHQGVPACPPAPAPSLEPDTKSGSWPPFSCTWGLFHLGLKANFYKTFCNPKRVRATEGKKSPGTRQNLKEDFSAKPLQIQV